MDTKRQIQSNSVDFRWLVKMAWRDSRKNRAKLFLFIISISLGIAALVGISSFRQNLLQEINQQAKTLIGADLEIRGNVPLPDSLFLELYTKVPELSRETYFASMVYFPRTDGTRLVQVRALAGNYPYYGAIETDPAEAGLEFKSGRFAVVDEKLMIQYNVEVGDSVKVGRQQFKIIGKLRKIPGQSGLGATAAPVVYIPYNYVDGTELIQKGSRVNYLTYLQYSEKSDTTGLSDVLVKIDQAGFEITDVEARKEDTGRAFSDLTNFLELVAFVALLLGCIGVASSMYVYTKEKVGIVATLRCLGLQSWQAIVIFLIEVASFGFIGSFIGSLLGVFLNLYLPLLLQEFVPVALQTSISWQSVAVGTVTGVMVSILFSLISLVSLRKVSPLQAIRSDFEHQSRWDWAQWAIGLVIFLFIAGMVYFQIQSVKDAFIFTGILFGAMVILGLIGRGIALLAKKVMPDRLPYVWRQGLSNLYRPHNQTTLLVITLGLGTAFIATLFFLQDLLVSRVTIAGSDDRPNTILFDIQTPQKEEVRHVTEDYDLPVIQEVPIVTMRLLEINGVGKLEAERDTTLGIPDWAYNREYRITYRETLIDSETITDGEWEGDWKQGDTIRISVAKGFAENLNLKIGDELLFNVQGAVLKTYIGSFRDIDWNRVQTNFLVLFPMGVLELAPQFHVLITRIQNTELSARYQQAIVRTYPNISIIDLELILQTLEEILGKIAFVIRFMALFSIGTGVLMLISSMVLSRYQRMKENALLRTLGATSAQLWKIAFSEYFFLGVIGSFTGLLLAFAFTMLLGKLVYDFVFVPDWIPALAIFTGVTLLTVTIGLLNSRSVLSQSPQETLRREG